MNKPERLAHPDFAHRRPAGLQEFARDLKTILCIAKDTHDK